MAALSPKSLMHRLQLAAISFTSLLAFCGCSKEGGGPVVKDAKSIQVGGLYASQNDDGSWLVMKVLAVDEHAVHLRMYSNRFSNLPRDVDPGILTLMPMGDPGGFGIGHVPVAREGFFDDNPVLIKVVPVKEEELEGYKLYLDAMKNRR